MYSPFVESLRRLYVAGKLAIEKADDLLAEHKIAQAEYGYITAQ